MKTIESTENVLYKVISNSLFGFGGILFFVGGRLLNAFFAIDRMSGEFISIIGGLLCALGGAVAKGKIDEPEIDA